MAASTLFLASASLQSPPDATGLFVTVKVPDTFKGTLGISRLSPGWLLLVTESRKPLVTTTGEFLKSPFSLTHKSLVFNKFSHSSLS